MKTSKEVPGERIRVEITDKKHAKFGEQMVVLARKHAAKQKRVAGEITQAVHFSNSLPRLLGFDTSADLISGLRITSGAEVDEYVEQSGFDPTAYAQAWLRELGLAEADIMDIRIKRSELARQQQLAQTAGQSETPEYDFGPQAA